MEKLRGYSREIEAKELTGKAEIEKENGDISPSAGRGFIRGARFQEHSDQATFA
jgi:hypothetical protein